MEFDAKPGPVTLFGVIRRRDEPFALLTAQGGTGEGPLLRIGHTTSRVDFGCGPGEWVDAWSATGVSRHWALGTGHRAADVRAVADLMGLE